MSNKQQTSVKWLIEQLQKTRDWQRVINEVNQSSTSVRNVIEQAQEMNHKEIAKAFDDGDYNYHYSRKTGNDFEDGQEYFNEIYK